jgi:mRNA-degrading endonuclease RelE of RelBE toxin-antitoxin system
MKYRRLPTFKKNFSRLPQDIQLKAGKAFLLFRQNPNHPSLHVKRMEGMPGVWEGRVDIHYRFTFHYEGDTVVLRNIGPHDILDKKP